MTPSVLYDIYDYKYFDMVSNKLFCTFVNEYDITDFINEIKNNYIIAYNKVFVLYVKSNDEYVCTYNLLDQQIEKIPANTILVHRKKEYNVLYTINSLNELIKTLNNGVVDPTFRINWQHYRNSILLTQQNELKHLKTKVYKIVDV